MSLRLLALFALLAAACPSTQAASSPPPAKVMIVSTFHLSNPGNDVFNVQVDDVLSKKRQTELAAITEALVRFAPDQVMVEWSKDVTDERYASFQSGTLPPSRDEVVQLGFRLAALRGLKQVHGIDVKGDFPFEPVKAYAGNHGLTPRLDAALADAGREVQGLSERVRDGSLGSVLRYMNAPTRAVKNHEFYIDMLRYGLGNEQPGADLVQTWYGRNLQICARLLQALPAGGRAVVFFGEGHAYLLRQCVIEAPGVELVEANDYLPK